MMTRREKKRLTWAYRNVFIKNHQGNEVLTDILNDLGFFSQKLESDADLVRHNVATSLLGKLGVWKPHNLFAVTDAFTSLPAFGPDDEEA